MKLAKLLHNPKAGEKSLTKKELTAFITEKGWDCRYSSTKGKSFSAIHPETDFIIVAGGDGTLRKAAEQIFERKLIEKKLPIALLPMGTANNIAKTLGITGELPFLIESWYHNNKKAFDIGKIEGLPGYAFFLEALGAGVFPKLIKEMDADNAISIETPEQEMKRALQKLYAIVLSYEAKSGKISIDENTYSGKFLLIEIMNIKSIGPNLMLAPQADPGDGELDIVLIYEHERQKLADYVLARIEEEKKPFPFDAIKGKRVSVSWNNSHLHVDDTPVKIDKNAIIKIELSEGMLDFLIPPAG